MSIHTPGETRGDGRANELRCKHCDRLIAEYKGVVEYLEIRCRRCGHWNTYERMIHLRSGSSTFLAEIIAASV